MKKEIKDLLKKAFGQHWASTNGWSCETEYHDVSRDNFEEKGRYCYVVNDTLIVHIECIKTFTNNLVPAPKVTTVFVAEGASLIDVLKAIGMAEKTAWYKKYCAGNPLYQVGCAWYSREEILARPDIAWMVTK